MSQKPVIFLAFANDRVDDAAYLRNLPRELDGIRSALQKAVKAGLCEVVERSNATIQNILDVFQDDYYKDRIGIFHYGGHANGYQLLLENLDGSHASAHSEGLVSFFAKQKGLKLIFLNGCSSQQQALDLIEAGIPAVIGTSQSINDDVAMNLSIRFYKGIASGHALEKAWLEAIDEVKIQKGTANMRDFFWDGMEDEATNQSDDEEARTKNLSPSTPSTLDRFPWEIYFKEGAELVKNWNLPEAVDNPLFGLPDLPKADLPEQPYRFLERYHREHAEIFFGRSYFIRELYNRATDGNSAPIILFYGQSGVGKSSMLDAGLFPRLEQTCQVVYVRRDAEKGLLGSVFNGLGEELEHYHTNKQQSELEKVASQIRQLKELQTAADEELQNHYEDLIVKLKIKAEHLAEGQEFTETQEGKSLKQIWFEQEEQNQKPLIILLDQVEEIYTKPNPDIPNEIDLALAEIQAIFGNPLDRPNGKLILSYRKEYNPEIEEAFKRLQLPREKVFLQKLERRDIEEIVRGLASTDRLQRTYELNVEKDLPTIIADDLLEDKDSPIAPVLQILLTKMWQLSEHEELRYFSVKKYQELKRQGILMDDFFHEQMAVIAQRYPELMESGLALDILYFHTTKLGTANSHTLENLRERYGERQAAIDRLVADFKDLYLLSDAGVQATGLAHDTLAPIVQEEFRLSDKPGQRAALILQNKRVAYEQDPNTVLDLDDLRLVEEGASGMRIWVQKEEELIEKSRKRRARVLAEKKRRKRLAILAVCLICLTSIFAFYKWRVANQAEADAKKSEEEAILARDQAIIAEKDALAAKDTAEQERAKAILAKEEADRQRGMAEYQKGVAQKQTTLAIQAKNDAIAAEKEAIDQKNIAVENELKSRRVVFGVKARKIAETDPMRGLRMAQLAYALDEENVPASVQETMMKIALDADLDEDYSMNTATPRTPFYDNFPGYDDVLLGRLTVSADGNYAYGMGQDSTLHVWNVTSPVSITADIKADARLTDAKFSPNSKMVVMASLDGKLKIWDLSANQLVTEINTGFWANAIDFSSDNQHVLTAAYDSTVKIWNLNGDLVHTIKVDNQVLNACFSSDGKQIIIHPVAKSVFIAENNYQYYTSLELWDVDSWTKVNTFGCAKLLEYVNFSPDGKFIYARSNDNEALVWSKNGSVFPLKGHTDGILWIDMSPDNKYVITGSKDGTAKVWELDQKSYLNVHLVLNLEHSNWVQQVKFVEGGKKILTACSDFTAKLWDLDGHLLANLKGHQGDVFSASVSTSTGNIITDSYDGTRKIWWMNRYFSRMVKRHKSYINNIDLTQNGKILTVSSDKTAMVWNTRGKMMRKLKGHTSFLYDGVFSPDQNMVVTASADGTVILWDVRAGEKTRLIEKINFAYAVDHVAFSPDGKSIGVTTSDGTAHIVEVNYTINPTKLLGHRGKLRNIVFSPNSELVLTYGYDSLVYVWKKDGSKYWENPIRHQGEVLSASFSPDGKWIATASKDHTIQIWGLDGVNKMNFSPHNNWVNKVVFSKDSKQFLTFGEYVAKRWELANGALVGTFTGHTSWVADGGFLPNNGVYTIAFDSTIRFWSYAGKELIQTLRFDEEYPKSVLLSSDAKQLLASYNSGGVKVWNKEGNKFPNQPSFSLDGHDGIITTLAHSPDETKVVTGGGDGHLVFWNTLTDQVTVSDPLTYPINSIAFSSDNSFVVASTTGNDAIQLGLDGKIITTFKGHINSINRVALAPNNQRLYTASADSYTGIWELNTGNAISYPHKHTQQVNSITTSPDGNYVVTASDDLSVILWKSDGTFIRTLGRKDYAYTDAQFSADGQKVLGLNASYVSIWDLAGNELAILNGHKTSLTSASFSADGQKVITSSTDGTAKVWSVTGTELFTLKGHTNYVNDAVFSRNGKYVVTSSNDQTVGLWLIDTEIPQLVASLKGHSGEVIKGFYFNRDNLILTASTDGTVRIWATPLRIYNYLKTWKASGISDNDLKAFGFTEAEIKQFKQNGWI